MGTFHCVEAYSEICWIYVTLLMDLMEMEVLEAPLMLRWLWQFFNRLHLTEVVTPPTERTWKEDLRGSSDQEPPDCWDADSCDDAPLPSPVGCKTWRGAATLIPKVPGTTKKQSAGCKQVGTHHNVTINVWKCRFFFCPKCSPLNVALCHWVSIWICLTFWCFVK